MNTIARHPVPGIASGPLKWPAQAAARRPRGFTIAEMLLALVILALLLTAVAAAVKGTLTSYVENNEIAATTQAARVVLNKMMSEVRTAQAVDSVDHGTWMNIIPPDNPQGLTLVRYDLTGDVFYCRQTVNGTETAVPVIASSDAVRVLGFDVTRQTALDGNGVSYTVQVSACLSLQAGSNPLVVTAATCPRRNLSY